jgi:hypothetical protein
MRRTLSALVAVFGSICLIISLVHIAFGSSSIPGSVPVNPTMDSEDRFYATLFTGFGITLIWCSFNLRSRLQVFSALLAVFFLGGVARIISAAAVGWPSGLFIFLGSLELLMPPLLWVWAKNVYAAPHERSSGPRASRPRFTTSRLGSATRASDERHRPERPPP